MEQLLEAKSLLILDSEYNLEEINDEFHTKNILIKDFSLENKIKELIKNLVPESIVVNSKYVNFISNNTNIRLFHDEEIIKKLVSYEFSYLAMKIMLNNDESVNNINKQLIIASLLGYSSIVKLLLDRVTNVSARNNEALIWALKNGHISNENIIKKLILI